MTTVTLLHPGAMGAAVAAQAVAAGYEVLWVPDGRSVTTHRRAKEAGATGCDLLGEALARSEIVLSICPPQAAEDVATTVAGHAFAGVYVDANAINPQRMRRIAEEIRPGAKVLDGAIFGPPPGGQRAARLYLAGEAQAVDTVQPVFKDTALHVRRANGSVGSASALKMAFASYQKAARTLAGVAHALANAHGVADELTADAEVMASNAQRGRTRLALGPGDGRHRRDPPLRRPARRHGRSGGQGDVPLGGRQGPVRPEARRRAGPSAEPGVRIDAMSQRKPRARGVTAVDQGKNSEGRARGARWNREKPGRAPSPARRGQRYGQPVRAGHLR